MAKLRLARIEEGHHRMRGREPELEQTLGLIEAGKSVDVVGARNSGRTAFLSAVRELLVSQEWTVVAVRGTASLSEHPYAAMHLAGIGSPSTARNQSTLQATVAALRGRLGASRSVLIIDDWEDLDETSWGVADTVRSELGVPLVRTRLQGLGARKSASGRTAAGLEPAFTIEMVPLGFEAMKVVVEETLGGPVDLTTMSRIYEKAGGSIGLAMTTAAEALRGGRIERTPDGWLVAPGTIWSPSLRGVVEAYLDGIEPEALDALEIIAHGSLVDMATARRLVDWPVLEALERRGLISTARSGSDHLVSVSPPLIADYFRHQTQSVRRARLAELIATRVGTGSPGWVLEPAEFGNGPAQGHHATIVTLMMQRQRTRRMTAEAEWERSRTPAAAVRYLRVLANDEGSAPAIADVLRRTERDDGDLHERAEYTLMVARVRATIEGDLDGALGYLSERAPMLGPFAPLLDAEQVSLLAQLRRIPDDWDARLAVPEGADARVQLGVLEARLLIQVALGRFVDAERTFERIGDLTGPVVPHLARLTAALAQAGRGQEERALALLRRGFEEAQRLLDVEALQIYASGLVTLLLSAGDYSEVDRVLDLVFAVGRPSVLPPGIAAGLFASAALTALRRGDKALGSHHVQSAARQLNDGVLPGQLISSAHAQALANDGHSDAGADLLWAASESLWERGARVAAALGFIGALELRPDGERAAATAERVAQIASPVLQAMLHAVTAVAEHDPDALCSAAEELYRAGRYGQAISTLRTAAALFLDERRTAEAETAEQLGKQYVARLRPRAIEAPHALSTGGGLTPREREVARLAAQGHSNQEIASSLVVSVRTVESHIYQALHKLGLANRQALRHYADRL